MFFVSDDLLLRMLAHALAVVDAAELAAAVHAGPARCVTGWRSPDAWQRSDAPGSAASRPATTVCRRCEVVVPCGLLALARREPSGVWGATTPRQRQALLRLLDQVTGRRPPRGRRRPALASPPPLRRMPVRAHPRRRPTTART